MLLKFVRETRVPKLEFCDRIFVMAYKRRQSGSHSQTSVVQGSLDVRQRPKRKHSLPG